MRHGNRFLAGALAIAGLGLSACTQAAGLENTGANVPPAKVEALAGTQLHRLTLSDRAVQRLGIQTAPVGAVAAARAGTAAETSIPFAALFYDPEGGAWVFTSPQPHTYVRERVVIDRVDGDTVVLRSGPPVGTAVVTVGSAELLGTELGVDGE